jgi:hypothetical protein
MLLLTGLLSMLYLSACATRNNINKGAAEEGGIFEQPLMRSESTYEGVSLLTELAEYAPGTKRILTYWQNDSDLDLIYGNPYRVEELVNEKWQEVPAELYFNMPAFMLPVGGIQKKVYSLDSFQEPLKTGHYRIVTEFSESSAQRTQHTVMAYFRISQDALGKSELDFPNLDTHADITPVDLEQSTGVRMYKNWQTYETVLSIEGELYEIAQGQGKWEVTQACLAEIEGNKYLVYVFSRSQKDELQSFAGVFDLKKKRNIYVSQALSARNLSVVHSEKPTVFPISDLELYEEGDHGLGGSAALGKRIGALVFRKGGFVFDGNMLEEIE